MCCDRRYYHGDDGDDCGFGTLSVGIVTGGGWSGAQGWSLEAMGRGWMGGVGVVVAAATATGTAVSWHQVRIAYLGMGSVCLLSVVLSLAAEHSLPLKKKTRRTHSRRVSMHADRSLGIVQSVAGSTLRQGIHTGYAHGLLRGSRAEATNDLGRGVGVPPREAVQWIPQRSR